MSAVLPKEPGGDNTDARQQTHQQGHLKQQPYSSRGVDQIFEVVRKAGHDLYLLAEFLIEIKIDHEWGQNKIAK